MTLSAHLLAALRSFLFVSLLLLCVPIQIVAFTLKLRARNILPQLFHRVLTRHILGFTVETAGTPHAAPTLFLCNHLSYLDTVSIASVVPTNFVAKIEVASWPLFGYLTKLQGAVFVDRSSKKGAQEKGLAVTDILKDKINITIFPEGTSTDGSEVKPFKSGLMQAVLDMGSEDVYVQPVSVAVYGRNGTQKHYPWVGDMTLMPHLWQAFGLTGLVVRFTFHEAVKASAFRERKEMAEFAQKSVARGPYGTHDIAARTPLPPAGKDR